uniref:Uncharacterized protein n=1 Tax=Arundo donax TaxID=35708 RepID=A0A0A8Z311_ARUDO
MGTKAEDRASFIALIGSCAATIKVRQPNQPFNLPEN